MSCMCLWTAGQYHFSDFVHENFPPLVIIIIAVLLSLLNVLYFSWYCLSASFGMDCWKWWWSYASYVRLFSLCFFSPLLSSPTQYRFIVSLYSGDERTHSYTFDFSSDALRITNFSAMGKPLNVFRIQNIMVWYSRFTVLAFCQRKLFVRFFFFLFILCE